MSLRVRATYVCGAGPRNTRRQAISTPNGPADAFEQFIEMIRQSPSLDSQLYALAGVGPIDAGGTEYAADLLIPDRARLRSAPNERHALSKNPP